MPTPELQSKRSAMSNAVDAHTLAKRTDADTDITGSELRENIYVYLNELINWYKEPNDDAIKPMILQFNAGMPDMESGLAPPPSHIPNAFEDPVYMGVIEVAPHCVLVGWDSECDALYNTVEQMMNVSV